MEKDWNRQGGAEWACVAGRCRVCMGGREVQSVDVWQGGAGKQTLFTNYAIQVAS